MSDMVGRLTTAIVRGLQDAGDLMFAQTQRVVNVDTGMLKKSGFLRYLPDGVMFGYRTPYAGKVNFGWAAQREMVRRHNVRRHRRRLYNSVRAYTYVRRHERGPFSRMGSAHAGYHYMEAGIDMYLKDLPKIIGRQLVRLAV